MILNAYCSGCLSRQSLSINIIDMSEKCSFRDIFLIIIPGDRPEGLVETIKRAIKFILSSKCGIITHLISKSAQRKRLTWSTSLILFQSAFEFTITTTHESPCMHFVGNFAKLLADRLIAHIVWVHIRFDCN